MTIIDSIDSDYLVFNIIMAVIAIPLISMLIIDFY